MSENQPQAAELIGFWREAGPDAWFRKDTAFDDAFRSRFHDLHMAAARRELDHWMETPEGALGLLLLLDQLPRNCFRRTGHMYATDPLARSFARKALAAGHLDRIDPELRVFMLLPFSHSEELADHEIAVTHNAELGGEYLKHAVGHRDIVARFGRFPHRNAILGRETTPEEQAFLDEGGFAG